MRERADGGGTFVLKFHRGKPLRPQPQALSHDLRAFQAALSRAPVGQVAPDILEVFVITSRLIWGS
jgi:hypothetical protein